MNLLVTGAFALSVQELDMLKRLGHTVVFMQQESDNLPCEYSFVEGVIGNGIFLHHPIEKFTSLKYIQLTSAGFDRVPMDYVKEHEISIFNAKGVYSVPMAEFAVCGVFQFYKQLNFFRTNHLQHKWEKHRHLFEFCGKTVAIVGCGNVGTECAKRFRAFGCVVKGVDVNPYQCTEYDEMLSLNDLKTVLSTADIVVLTLPLTDETYHLINDEYLQSVKPCAVLVNISRGAVVDTDALINALNKECLLGAVLDVFEEEPLNENSPLWDMDNVILTPHNSFVGEYNHERMWNVILRNLKGAL